MGDSFRIIKEVSENSETVTITIPKILEAKELYWLNQYSINEFDKALIDLETGKVILTISTIIYNTEKSIKSGN